LKVVILLKDVPSCKEFVNFSFGSDVFISISPPANSPGKSAFAVLITRRLSTMFDGNISNENALLSDSELGNGKPLSNAKLYLSFKPLTTTKRLSTTLIPVTLLKTSETLESGVFLKVSALIPSTDDMFILWIRTNSEVDSLLIVRLTVTSFVFCIESLTLV